MELDSGIVVVLTCCVFTVWERFSALMLVTMYYGIIVVAILDLY